MCKTHFKLRKLSALLVMAVASLWQQVSNCFDQIGLGFSSRLLCCPRPQWINLFFSEVSRLCLLSIYSDSEFMAYGKIASSHIFNVS